MIAQYTYMYVIDSLGSSCSAGITVSECKWWKILRMDRCQLKKSIRKEGSLILKQKYLLWSKLKLPNKMPITKNKTYVAIIVAQKDYV